MPLFSLIFGGILDAFNGFDAERRVDQYSLYFLYLAIASFLLNVCMSCCFSISSERQIRRMRSVLARKGIFSILTQYVLLPLLHIYLILSTITCTEVAPVSAHNALCTTESST
jgi:ABC transporter transmembrane region